MSDVHRVLRIQQHRATVEDTEMYLLTDEQFAEFQELDQDDVLAVEEYLMDQGELYSSSLEVLDLQETIDVTIEVKL